MAQRTNSSTTSNPNTTTSLQKPLTGRCACAHITYTLTSAPLIVHACHCTYCQRESGSSFALNAIYEPDRVHLTGPGSEADLLRVAIPTLSSSSSSSSSSGRGQEMLRCPKCYTVIYSHYAAGGPLKIVRVGTVDGVLDEEGRYVANGGLKPDAHIFAGDEKRHRWFDFPPGSVVYEGYGPRGEYWSAESLTRLEEFTKRNEGVSSAFSAVSKADRSHDDA